MQNSAFLILMVGAIAVMMVFSSRNKKKQAAKAQELQASIVPGTRVMTTSGMHATVTAVADDTIELEIAPGIYTTWVRAAVREIVVPATDDAEYSDAEFDAPEYDDADYAELSGQEIEPVHDDHPSLEKRSNDVKLEKRNNDVN